MDLESCLPAFLRGPDTKITRIAAGLSGAGVYRVDAAGQSFVLKISDETEPLDTWNRKFHIQQLAADAGISPRVVHSDGERRCVLTDLIVDRSFPGLYSNPATRERAIVEVAQLVRRLHDIPLPADTKVSDGPAFLASMWSSLGTSFPVPPFVSELVEGMMKEAPPPAERALVLSHNDVNPSNVIYDGARLWLLDWEVAAANDPYYDLATVAVFVRLDEPSCLALLSAYDGSAVSSIPARFIYLRRLVGTLAGTAGLNAARRNGHVGTHAGSIETTLSLGEVYQRMRSGEVNLATAEGQVAFGLALLKESAAM